MSPPGRARPGRCRAARKPCWSWRMIPSCGIWPTVSWKALGYESAAGRERGQEALRVAREHKGSPIRLVITDVIMPSTARGRQSVMAEWLQTTRIRDLQILFTSGYTDDALTQHGVLEDGVEFLPKPYTPATLGRKVREMIDRTSESKRQPALLSTNSWLGRFAQWV